MNPVDSFLALVRIAGASFPGSASMVQWQAEIDMTELRRRVSALEDPISALHPNVPETARVLYGAMVEADSTAVDLAPQEYERLGRPLAILESEGFIKAKHAIGNRFAGGIRLADPTFILYAATLEGLQGMASVTKVIDGARRGQWLAGNTLSSEHEVPLDVVRAIFRIYEARGLGMMSKETGPHRATRYLVKA